MILECHTEGSGSALEAELSAIVLALKDHISHCDHSSESSLFSSIDLSLGSSGDEFRIRTSSYTLTVSQVSDPIIRANFVQRCLALWPVSTPTLLEICCTSSGVTAMELIQALSTEALNCVDRVMLRETAGDFFAALFEQNESATVPLLPGLQEITLQRVHLVPLIQLQIRVVLKLRKEAGVPIRRLKLDHCSNMSRSWAHEFQSDFGVELSYDDETQQQSRL
ncbi:hypothetical protein EWM64_g334 [Hericium alpestre]|uniref:Uncharacterized protein n=1 Tax=Hericium alpestre TaxID=135208 RepID=A0A4Z0A9C9_9AGAM|nr:hypothetical protein EWM64_g334 [Hericium alpestre]